MSNVSFKRLSVALVGLAVPFSLVGAAAAAPSAGEIAGVQLACQAYYDVSTCQGAVTDGVYDVIEGDINGELAGEGIDYAVELGEAGLAEPGALVYDINGVAVNPLPPLIPVPAVPGVPFQ
ncbi:MAG: hypothetical protein QM692_22505 [Thermomicrobiales bacterium]